MDETTVNIINADGPALCRLLATQLQRCEALKQEIVMLSVTGLSDEAVVSKVRDLIIAYRTLSQLEDRVSLELGIAID